jgi:hypothetical protein
MNKPILPKVDPFKPAEDFFNEQVLKAQKQLDEIKLPEYKVTKAEKLQHKLRHVPTAVGAVSMALGAALLKTGQVAWGTIALTVGGLLTPVRTVLETQTKYGEKGTYVRKDWLQMIIDFLKFIIGVIKKLKGA